jgi:hypothetical protein
MLQQCAEAIVRHLDVEHHMVAAAATACPLDILMRAHRAPV